MYSTLQNRPHPLRKRRFCRTPVELGYSLLVSANLEYRDQLAASELAHNLKALLYVEQV
jgi:hypothetical protein